MSIASYFDCDCACILSKEDRRSLFLCAHAIQVSKMSLLQHRFSGVVEQRNEAEPRGSGTFVPDHLPLMNESGLGMVEYREVTRAVSELSDPQPQVPGKKRNSRGGYTKCTPKQHAVIGKYALENGNEKATCQFLNQFPKLTESTVRNFKKSYKEELDKGRKEFIPQSVTEIVSKTRGRLPIFLELDEKLQEFLKGIRMKGGVVNSHVVRAPATALIGTNPSTCQHLHNFSMPRCWT